MLEDGAAHTLVATRGLVGEGWNYPGLNVLVDLTEVASPTAMTQLRGRALRIDPDEPAKVASLWDVVVAHPTAHGNWTRFRRRHARWWGPDWDGAMVTGARKVHPLATTAAPPPAHLHDAMNQASAARLSDHAGTSRIWAELDADGIATSELRFPARRGRRGQVRTRGARWRRTGVGAAVLGGATTSAVTLAAQFPVAVAVAGFVAVAAGVLGVVGRGRARSREDTARLLGDAVAAGLTAAGYRDLGAAQVTAKATPDGVTTVIHGVDDDMARLWADAFEELVGPLGTPRWLLTAGDAAWRVPKAASTNKLEAEWFAYAFRQRVPGTRLVRAGTPEATELTLRAARERPGEVVRAPCAGPTGRDGYNLV
ncbi:hypothetical protein [Actinophytocola sp.]|uniref:hypothetical protein n=1 Tax=Actinophytocola sp. TaxID=1872138 RepID=UPI002ED21BF5